MDPLVPLTLSLVRSPGRYALLLGSGISRSAGIPTGWIVIERLLNDAAAAAGAGTPPDVFAWFRDTYGAEAGYSDILRDLGPTPADRQRLIHTYIEPEGSDKPAPTAAHRAIADLIKGGAIRIVITTNFDDLLERALSAAGAPYHVVASPDAVEGSPPFSHGGTFIFKIHGDYRDERLLNTIDELNGYDSRVTALLDRLLDEFGLIVCGWSGEWDIALRGAIERVRGRRFATYWMTITEPTDAAKAIIEQRDATVIPIRSADRVFADLADRVAAVRDVRIGDVNDGAAAAALIKRYLSDPAQPIRLHDAVMGEAARLLDLFTTADFSTDQPASNSVEQRLRQYESATNALRAMLIVLGYWGSETQVELVDDAIALLLRDRPLTGYIPHIDATIYPAILAANAFALGAFAAKQYVRIATFMDRAFERDHNGNVLRDRGWELLVPTYALTPPAPQGGHHGLWWSDRLANVLNDTFQTLLVSGDARRTLERLEHFVAFLGTIASDDGFSFPAAGRGAYRRRHTASLIGEAEASGATWPGFAAGFPEIETLRARAARYDTQGPPKEHFAFALNLGA